MASLVQDAIKLCLSVSEIFRLNLKETLSPYQVRPNR
jgi:hypothetical protein